MSENNQQKSMDYILINVINYEKYNDRKIVKNPNWFRMSNRFLEHPDFFDFSHSEMICWFYFLSLASQKNSDSVKVNFLHAERVCRIKKDVVFSAIEKLIELQCVTIDATRMQHACNTHVARMQHDKQTNKTNKQYCSSGDERVIDLESAYDAYPRKQGKTKGLQKLKTQIKSFEQFELLKKSISNYKSFLLRKKTEPQFIKIFSTFCNEWEDWIDERSGEINLVQKQESLLQKELREEKEAKQISLVSEK